ncbi:Ldh family oxidoreductase [Candidatus Bipolaricaulota bacterium]|nr:Ldh family oxidoreductase [Candidatus Bipolaricaulota bacterium]
MERTVYVPVETLQGFMCDVFVGVGVPPDDARIAASVLIASDLRGIESHGVSRLKMYYDWIKKGIISPQIRFEVVREGPTTAVVDGHTSLGHPIAHRSMALAIEKARQCGLGAVAVRNSSHYGIAGYYALMAAREGMIGMSFTNARPSVAPTFGVQPMLGTNPIAFAAPTDEPFPFVFDAATSIAQRGKIEVLAREGKPTPAGWVIDREGHTATDTAGILAGLVKDAFALLPLGGVGEEMGGHKGYGLATMVEILCAALQCGSFLHALSGFDPQGRPRPHRLGHFFLAMNIAHFVPLVEFKRTAGEILRELRASAKAPGEARIYTAGEKAHLREQEVRARGVPIDPGLQRDLKAIQAELGLVQHRFPF